MEKDIKQYFIAYTFEGTPKKYHIKLSDELAEKFKLKPVSARIPPHLTLKAPFEAEDISEIEKILETFVEKEKSQPITLGGFESFKGKVIYVDVAAPKQTHMLIRRLQDKLRNIPQLSFKPYEFPIVLHATLCYPKNSQQAKEILSYLSHEKPISFSLSLDNVTLLEKQRGVWTPINVYHLHP